MSLDPSLDAGAFLEDFGVSVVWTDPDGNQVTVLGMLDAPDQAMNLGFTVMGNDYSVTFATADIPGIKNGDPVTVDGAPYLIRDLASVDDGVFTKSTLKKV